MKRQLLNGNPIMMSLTDLQGLYQAEFEWWRELLRLQLFSSGHSSELRIADGKRVTVRAGVDDWMSYLYLLQPPQRIEGGEFSDQFVG
jgi:hypothetical protein